MSKKKARSESSKSLSINAANVMNTPEQIFAHALRSKSLSINAVNAMVVEYLIKLGHNNTIK